MDSNSSGGWESLGWNRIDLGVALAIIVFCAMELACYQRIESYSADSSYYIGLADSLVNQHRYIFDFKPHTLYPPGFPAILALISLVFGASYGVYVRAMAIFGALGLWTSYILLRRAEGRAAGATACLLLGSSPFFFRMTTQNVISDVPFFFCSMLALVAARHVSAADTGFRRWLWGSVFLLLVVASQMIRSVGVALLGGLLAWLAWSVLAAQSPVGTPLRVFLVTLVLGILVQAAWMQWTKRAEVRDWPGEYMNTYLNQIQMEDPQRPDLGKASGMDLAARALKNLPTQSAHVSELVTRISWVDQRIWSPLALVPIALVLLGVLVSICDNAGQLEDWYFPAYTGLYLLWPFDEGPRFIFPVFPLVWVYLWRG